MAYDEGTKKKYASVGNLEELIKDAEKSYAKKTEFETLSQKVDGLVSAGGEANKIEKIKVNGEEQTITPTDKSVDIEVPQRVEDLTDGGEYAKTADIEGKINAKISSVYKPGGSLESADTTKLSSENVGMVYNISAQFNTDADHFVEGVSKSYPAGTNIVVVEDGSDTYKFDVLSGFVDLSSYATTENLTQELAKKANASHNHNASEITDLEDTLGDYVTSEDLTSQLATKQEKGDYVTNTALTSKLGGKADTEHEHQISDITDFATATNEEIQEMISSVRASLTD